MRLIKVVEGNKGTKRISISKNIAKKINLGDYVSIKIVNNCIVLIPVEIIEREIKW